MEIDDNDITIILQGSTLPEYNGKRCIELSVKSVKTVLPNCKVIISTWKNEEIPDSIKPNVDKIIFNKDPGFKTRDCKPDGKPNNVNRQIVSTLSGLRNARTKYTMKMRTDFLLKSRNFINYFDKYDKYDEKYKIFKRHVLCLMMGTRKPRAENYNLPFHVADFSTFGLTEDLLTLYDIQLVSDEEFEWFIRNADFMPDTFARNKYNAEQSIWINCLKKMGVNVKCEYSTHVNDEIYEQSENYLINNFCPLTFKNYGVRPLKDNLTCRENFRNYCDYYTQIEWLKLYKQKCDNTIKVPEFDYQRFLINLFLHVDNRCYPKFVKSIFKRIRSFVFDA